MELKQLRYFVVSVDTGSFSQAAQILYTTQPHVSKTIQNLEKDLGMQLLKRSKKGVVLTREGGEVYLQARKILRGMETIREIKGEREESVLKLSSMPCSVLAAGFTEFFSQTQRKIRTEFLEGTLEQVLYQVCHFYADLGFVFVSEYQRRAFESLLTRNHLEFCAQKEARLGVFVGPKNPWFHCRRIRCSELKKMKYVQYQEEEISLYRYPGHLKEEMGDIFVPDSEVTVRNDFAMFQLLKNTQLASIHCILTEAEKNQDVIRCIELEDCNIKILFGYVKRKNDILGKCEREFLAFLEKMLLSV